MEHLDVPAAQLGEGPLWDWRTGTLLWVDITRRTVFRHDPATGATRSIATGSDVGCVALTDHPDRVLAALRSGITELSLESGDRRLVAHPEAARPDHRFNDGAVDPAGRFWVGTLEDGERRPEGALYRFDGAATVADRGFVCANGIAWSPDGSTMYFVDSPRKAIYRYAFDVVAGTATDRRVFVDTGELPGLPDGIETDAEGFLWCAFWDGARLVRFTPEGGIDRTVPVPVLRPTSMAFGGPDLTTVYVTSARQGLSVGDLDRWPASGTVLILRDLGTGRRAGIFRDRGSPRPAGA